MSPGAKLRKLLAGERIVVGGGAHDALSARIVEQAGYPMCVVTGAGVSMCRGYPDVGLVTMEEMVRNARYIAEAIALMKTGVIFINTSRGKVQEEEALRVAIEGGKIRAAGIDVFEEEPVSSDSRRLQLDNVIVSPHIAGVTEETTRGMAMQVTAEMLRVLRGEKPHVLGNPDLWPKLAHLK